MAAVTLAQQQREVYANTICRNLRPQMLQSHSVQGPERSDLAHKPTSHKYQKERKGLESRAPRRLRRRVAGEERPSLPRRVPTTRPITATGGRPGPSSRPRQGARWSEARRDGRRAAYSRDARRHRGRRHARRRSAPNHRGAAAPGHNRRGRSLRHDVRRRRFEDSALLRGRTTRLRARIVACSDHLGGEPAVGRIDGEPTAGARRLASAPPARHRRGG